MKPPRLHPIPLGVPANIGTPIETMRQRERNTPTYQPHRTYTGTELMERLRATPQHLRPGQQDN